MSDPQIGEKPFPSAEVRQRRFLAVWLIPVIAALIAGYLAVRSYIEHGPEITISFKTGEGLSAGQTQIRYKSVTLGTVESINLTDDLSRVVAHARMTGGAKDLLTDHTRFWIVRPALTSSNFTDIQSLVAGTYIQLEPGAPDGKSKTNFKSLDKAPDNQSDDPGTVYLLKADNLRGINVGSPVYFRDLNVGQVLGFDIGDGFESMTVSILVRDPYAKFVRSDSRFWNASGLSFKINGGLHVEFQSLQSVLVGGIAFYTPADAEDAPQADAHSIFSLYENRKMAELDGDRSVGCVSYFQSPVKDLARGSPVEIYGIQVGEVTDVVLKVDPQDGQSHIRVAYNVQPKLVFGKTVTGQPEASQILNGLMQKGMRTRLESSEIIVGQQQLSLEFVPSALPAQSAMEGDAMVIPGASGDTSNIANALGEIAGKLNQIPFAEIGDHLDHLLESADQTIGGPEMKQAVHSLMMTLQNAEQVSSDAKDNLSPAMKRLPEISAQLQSAATHANDFLASVNNGYGDNSDFERSVKRVMDEVNDAARSIRLLSDYVDRHPEALLQGRGNGKDKQ